MRWHEVNSGVQIPLSGEEGEIMDRVKQGRLARSELDERQQEVARRMVSRGVLRRLNIKDKAYFEAEGCEDLWRI